MLPTYSNYSTIIDIGEGVTLQSTGSMVYLNLINTGSADSYVDNNSTGIITSANDIYATNDMIQNGEINIGKNAVIEGSSAVIISSNVSSIMSAITELSEGGTVSDGTVQAYNNLYRYAVINLGENVSIISNNGNITIQNIIGASDNIVVKATGGDKGFIALADATAILNLEKNEGSTNIESGTFIQAASGDVNIYSSVGAANIDLYASGESKSFGGSSYVVAGIRKSDGSGDGHFSSYVKVTDATIEGNDIQIYAELGEMNIKTETYSFVGGTGYKLTSDASMHVNLDNTVKITDSDIIGTGNVDIFTQVNSATDIELTASSDASGISGKMYTYANIIGSIDSEVVVSGDTLIQGSNIDIYVNQKISNKDLSATSEGGKLAVKDEKEAKDRMSYTNIVDTASSVDYIVLKSAPMVSIYEDANGDIVYEKANGEITVVIDHTDKTVTVSNVSNVLSDGSLANSGLRVYTYLTENDVTYHTVTGNVSYLEALTSLGIINSTDYTLILDHINVYNLASDIDAIVITSEGSGDVILAGIVNHETGTVKIEWTGSTNGNLYSLAQTISELSDLAAVWAYELIIINANEIGTEDNLFHAFLSTHESLASKITAYATGNTYLSLTATDLNVTTDLSEFVTSTVLNMINFYDIAIEGNLYIELQSNLLLNYLENLSGIAKYDGSLIQYILTSVVAHNIDIVFYDLLSTLFGEQFINGDYHIVATNGNIHFYTYNVDQLSLALSTIFAHYPNGVWRIIDLNELLSDEVEDNQYTKTETDTSLIAEIDNIIEEVDELTIEDPISEDVNQDGEDGIQEVNLNYFLYIGLVLFLISFFIILFVIKRRKKEDEEEV